MKSEDKSLGEAGRVNFLFLEIVVVWNPIKSLAHGYYNCDKNDKILSNAFEFHIRFTGVFFCLYEWKVSWKCEILNSKYPMCNQEKEVLQNQCNRASYQLQYDVRRTCIRRIRVVIDIKYSPENSTQIGYHQAETNFWY